MQNVRTARRDLAAPLKQCAVGVEQQLRVVQGVAVALVDADGHDHARLFHVADGVRGRRRHSHRLVDQPKVLAPANDLVAGWRNEKYG
jgi:hypothetical protein